MKSLLALAILSSSALASSNYVTYTNARFGFSIERPADMQPGPEPENGDGLKFTGHGMTLTAYGATRSQSPEDCYKMDLASWKKDGKVTYHLQRPNFFVISGRVGGQEFYQRTIIGPQAFASVLIEHPAVVARETASFKSTTEHIIRSLKFRT